MVSPSEKKELAKESYKTKKARDKLKERFRVMDEKITKDALERKSIEIHRWISKYADQRITLKDKDISLFDENQNAAAVSQKISKLVDRFKLDDLPE